MKKLHLFIATLLVVVATTIAVVSCKKEAPETMLNSQPQVTKSYYPEGVDDMDAHLRDFKQKMKDSPYTRDNETLSLEEATWYLSSVANYDFCNVNVEFTDLRYDTLYYNVNVSNGLVSLTDLNTLYQSVASDIDDFYQSLNLENKHFRFIGASISNSGEVVVTLITSFFWLDHTWHFTDGFEAFVMCDSLFSEDSTYVWNTTAVRELQRVLNLLEGHDFEYHNSTYRGYYVYTRTVAFHYMDYIDPYGSPFYMDSRVFAVHGDTYYVHVLDLDEMCYCLDSYLGLPFEYINAHPNLANERPVHWNILHHEYYSDGDKWHIFAHIVSVRLAQLVETEVPNDY